MASLVTLIPYRVLLSAANEPHLPLPASPGRPQARPQQVLDHKPVSSLPAPQGGRKGAPLLYTK